MSTVISKVKTDALSTDESKRLPELERQIQHGLATFIEMGEALREIRDLRFYWSSTATSRITAATRGS